MKTHFSTFQHWTLQIEPCIRRCYYMGGLKHRGKQKFLGNLSKFPSTAENSLACHLCLWIDVDAPNWSNLYLVQFHLALFENGRFSNHSRISNLPFIARSRDVGERRWLHFRGFQYFPLFFDHSLRVFIQSPRAGRVPTGTERKSAIFRWASLF